MVRFASMASIKRELVLGCFMLACTLLFIFVNRYVYHPVKDAYGCMYRVNKLTGVVQLTRASRYDEPEIPGLWYNVGDKRIW